MESVERRTLFVGNLSQDVNEALLHELCTQAGPVESVVIARPKKVRDEAPVRKEDEVAYVEVRGCFYFIQNNASAYVDKQVKVHVSNSDDTETEDDTEIEKSEKDAKQLEKGTYKEDEQKEVEEPKEDQDAAVQEQPVPEGDPSTCGFASEKEQPPEQLATGIEQDPEKSSHGKGTPVKNKDPITQDNGPAPPEKDRTAPDKDPTAQETGASVQDKELNPNRHLGYGFVLFEHECSVAYAIQIFRGTELFGRRLTLQFKTKSGAKTHRAEPDNNHNTRYNQADNGYNSRSNPADNAYNSRTNPADNAYNSRTNPADNAYNMRSSQADNAYNSRWNQADNAYYNARPNPSEPNHTGRWGQENNAGSGQYSRWHQPQPQPRNKYLYNFHDARLTNFQGNRYLGSRGYAMSYWNERQEYPDSVNGGNFRLSSGNRDRNGGNDFTYVPRADSVPPEYENYNASSRSAERGPMSYRRGEGEHRKVESLKSTGDVSYEGNKATAEDGKRNGHARRECVPTKEHADVRSERRVYESARRRGGRPSYEDFLLKYDKGETDANARKKPSECYVKLSESFDVALDKFRSAKMAGDAGDEREKEQGKPRRRKNRKK